MFETIIKKKKKKKDVFIALYCMELVRPVMNYLDYKGDGVLMARKGPRRR